MLTKKQYLAILLVSIIPLMFYLGVRDDLMGNDSYHFLSYVCETNYIDNGSIDDMMPLGRLIMNVMPCNIPFIKVMLWLMLLTSSIIVAHLGKLYHNDGWLAGLLIFLSPYWNLEFVKFEEDVFAFPLLFLSFYLFMKGVKERNRKYQAMGLGLALFSGLIWKGSIAYVFAYTMFYPIMFLFSIVIAHFMSIKFFGTIIPQLDKLGTVPIEEYPLVGLFTPVVLLMGILWAETALIYPLIYFGVLATLRWSLSLHLLPILAVCFVNKFRDSTNKQRYFIFAFMLVVVISSSASFIKQPPTMDEKNAIQTALEYSDDNVIYNDWSIGYFVEYYGGVPSHMGSPMDQNFLDVNGIVITARELNHCEVLAEYEYYIVYSCLPKDI